MVEEIIEEAVELVARVAALDIGKASLVACVRVPHETRAGARRQEARTFATTTRSLLELQDWLVAQGVSLWVMEATSTYWKPPFYLLEDATECWVVNARDVKNVPGRPKTDRLDAVWLAKLAERGMLRPSFVPPVWQRELRDLCRYRRTLTQERTREKQRAEKLLEDTQIKLPAVISGIFGVSGRGMLEALIAGQHGPIRAGPDGPRVHAQEDQRLAGGADWAFPRPSRLPAADDARPRGCANRPDRGADGADRGGDRPVRPPGGPAR